MLGDDWCVACWASLADVVVQCPSNHRIYCSDCFERLLEDARRSRHRLRCGKCMMKVKHGRDSTSISCIEVQLDATRMADAYVHADDGNQYPWEILDFGTERSAGHQADLHTMRNVREAIRRCSEKSREKMLVKLRDHLTETEFEYVFLEFIKHIDLHQVLKLLLEQLETALPLPLAEVTALGVVSFAIAGAIAGPAVVAPLLAALGGSLGELIAKGRSSVGWGPEKARAKEKAQRLKIDMELDGFVEAREKFQNHVLKILDDAQETCQHIADWQILRGYYCSYGEPSSYGERPRSQKKELGVYVHIMKTRESVNEDWKLARSWFGSAMNAPVSEGETLKVEAFTLYL